MEMKGSDVISNMQRVVFLLFLFFKQEKHVVEIKNLYNIRILSVHNIILLIAH